VQFTAEPVGGTAPYEYQFWVMNPSGTWSSTPESYGPSNIFNWNTTGLPTGTYRIVVWARSQGSPNDVDASALSVYALE
jgi:hypothetical protein